MSKWHTLGTIGGPIHQAEGFQISNLLESGEDLYLVDVGNGVLKQLAKLDKKVAKIRGIFVTHHHPYHIADLGLVILSLWLLRPRNPLFIAGPRGTKHMFEGLIKAYIDVSEIEKSYWEPIRKHYSGGEVILANDLSVF